MVKGKGDFDEYLEDTSKIKEPKEFSKEVKLQHTGRQYILQLPIDFVEALSIKKGDTFIIKASLDKTNKYSIKLKKDG